MTAPALSLSVGPAARGAAPSLESSVDSAGASPASGDGSFAAALEDAGAAGREEATSTDGLPTASEATTRANDSANAGSAASAGTARTDAPTDAPTGAASVTAPTAAVDGAAAPAAAALANNDASAAAGWPPPGLSSLFPSSPLFAAANAAAAPLQAGAGASPPTPLATLAGRSAPFPLLPLPGNGAIALPPDALGPRLPDPPLAAATLALPAITAAAAGGMSAQATVVAQAHAAALDPIAAALARQPATLRLPIADEDGSALEALSTGSLAAPDALAGFDVLPALASTPAAAPRLDLVQAFPAPVPLPSPRFAEELGARVQWVAEQQGGEATLRIAPEGLGPVEIRLKLDGERVDLGFSATQNETRQALQDALPKLREMLAQQGLQLGHADVGHRQAHTPHDGHSDSGRGFGEDEVDGAIRIPAVRETTLVLGRGGRGVLDLYA